MLLLGQLRKRTRNWMRLLNTCNTRIEVEISWITNGALAFLLLGLKLNGLCWRDHKVITHYTDCVVVLVNFILLLLLLEVLRNRSLRRLLASLMRRGAAISWLISWKQSIICIHIGMMIVSFFDWPRYFIICKSLVYETGRCRNYITCQVLRVTE